MVALAGFHVFAQKVNLLCTKFHSLELSQEN